MKKIAMVIMVMVFCAIGLSGCKENVGDTNLNFLFYILVYSLPYVISILASQFLIKHILDNMWGQVNERMKKEENTYKDGTNRPFQWYPQAIGLLESALYTTACFINNYEIIGAWLLLKVAGSYSQWSSSDNKYGRTIFNIFLIGNGLLILYPGTTVLVIKGLIENGDVPSIILPSVSFIFLAVLSVVLVIRSKRQLKTEQGASK